MDGYASVEEEKKMYKLNDMTDLVSTNIFKQARMGFRWRMPAVAPCRGVADHAPPTASCGKDHGRGALVALWGRERAKCFTSCLSASSPRGLPARPPARSSTRSVSFPISPQFWNGFLRLLQPIRYLLPGHLFGVQVPAPVGLLSFPILILLAL